MAFAVLIGARHKYTRPSKVSQFGSNFKVQIIVDNDVVRPFRKISGTVIIETKFPIKHQGLLIQFEGLCTLRYPTKFENRTTYHYGRELLLESVNSECDRGYYQSSIQHILVPRSDVPFNITPGEVNFPFTLEFPENPHSPAPFKNAYGSLIYRLIVYMNETSPLKSHVQIGERHMRFNGHYNLLTNPMARNPISIEQNFKSSVFSRKKLVEVLFLVESSGFLQGELIPFRLSFRNPKSLALHISVHLIQHIKFNAANRRDSVKRKTGILAKMERHDHENGPEWTWMDSLRIPEDQGPSYTSHYIYQVSYSIQFKVKVLAEVKDFGSFVIKGEAPLYIGTTRSSVELLKQTANNPETPFRGMRRQGSVSSMNSVKSYTSVRTTCSLPPAYSQLSSRMPSWETLPPSYDELEMPDDAEGDDDDIGFDFDSLNLTTRMQALGSTPEEDANALCDSK
ncbi:unnamed protein product [Orchesella dallaii]|uniref:Arrestin C-terminal-like domain-containing protein n=1 Tax=Orchesella dallaii TaxID=48710 RepID=A0ABP1QV69_9HEXA